MSTCVETEVRETFTFVSNGLKRLDEMLQTFFIGHAQFAYKVEVIGFVIYVGDKPDDSWLSPEGRDEQEIISALAVEAQRWLNLLTSTERFTLATNASGRYFRENFAYGFELRTTVYDGRSVLLVLPAYVRIAD